MKKTYRFIGIGTIYRNLNDLVTKEILMRHHGIGDAVIYELQKPFHGHIYCQNSNMIQDIDLSGINLDAITLPKDFCLDEIQITIAGSYTGTDSPYCKIMGKVVRNKGFWSSL
jgi:Fe2+ or Zn2+ uptake regulation protein